MKGVPILMRLAAPAVLAGIFVYDLVLSSFQVARIVLSRRLRTSPAIVEVPVELRTRLGVGTVANLISLTPGSTCLHVSEDRRTLNVHVLDAPSPEAKVREFNDLIENRIRRIEG